MKDALTALKERGLIVDKIERTEKRDGDVVLDSWARPVRIVQPAYGTVSNTDKREVRHEKK